LQKRQKNSIGLWFLKLDEKLRVLNACGSEIASQILPAMPRIDYGTEDPTFTGWSSTPQRL
jgi:hypothetical protein